MSFTSFSQLFRSSGERKSASSPHRRKKYSSGWAYLLSSLNLAMNAFIRLRKPVIESFFHIVCFHNLPFIELYIACPWVGILISCAFPSSFSDDCCKACREKIRSCVSKRKIFSQATKPLQGRPCAIIRKNNYLCCKK